MRLTRDGGNTGIMHTKAPSFARALAGFLASLSLTTTLMVVLAEL